MIMQTLLNIEEHERYNKSPQIFYQTVQISIKDSLIKNLRRITVAFMLLKVEESLHNNNY